MIVSVRSSVQVDSLATVSDFILSGFIHWHMCLFAQPPGCVFPVVPVQYQNLCEKTSRPRPVNGDTDAAPDVRLRTSGCLKLDESGGIFLRS